MKCMKLKPKVLPQSLTVHMEVLSQLRHRHLVSIVGHCIVAGQDHPSTAGTVYIVHEHVSNGSLRDYLNGKANTFPFSPFYSSFHSSKNSNSRRFN